jgi:hypothetical protein
MKGSFLSKGTFKNKCSNEKIKCLLKEVLYNSLAQAIIKIIQTPHLAIKLFLVVCVVSSSSLASYLVIESIMQFFTYGVTTTSRTIFETPTLFPKVTFCNYNRLGTKYAYDLMRLGTLDVRNLSNEEKKKLGHDIRDILINCWFNGNPCDSNDFTWSFDPWYYNCYTFNSGFNSNGTKIDLKQSTISGPEFGLKLRLYVNIYEFFYYNANGYGIIVRIDNSSYSTYYSNGDGILLSPGFQTNIAVDREFHSMLPKPYSNCEIDTNSPSVRPDSEIYNVIRQSEYVYTNKLCFTQCYQSYIINKYNCSYPDMLSLFNVSECNLEKVKFNSTLDSFSIDLINEKCLSSCPLECNQNLYKTSASSGQFNQNSPLPLAKIKSNPSLASDFTTRLINSATSKESFVNVNIFYDRLFYTQSIESPKMDLVSLLASFGGSLGLFLGVNVFSIFEIVQLIMEIFYITKGQNRNLVESFATN